MRLRVALLGVKPAPWRRVEVAATATLAGLHAVIQAAMGWGDLHLHRFRILGRQHDGEQADLTRVRLADLRLRAGERFSASRRSAPARRGSASQNGGNLRGDGRRAR
jgi:hypothetical protein